MSPWPASRSGSGRPNILAGALPHAAGAQRNKTFARKVDAQRFLAGVENAKVVGTYVDPSLSQITLGDWAEQWLAGQTHLKPTTRSRYAGIISKHLQPRWGRVKLANVSHGDVQAWITDLAGSHSPATVHKIHRVLSLVLDLAVKDGRLVRNVSAGVNLPRTVKHEHRYLTHDQVDDLATATGYPAGASKFSSLDTRTNETTGSSCSSWPTPECDSERWPHCASPGWTCNATVPSSPSP